MGFEVRVNILNPERQTCQPTGDVCRLSLQKGPEKQKLSRATIPFDTWLLRGTPHLGLEGTPGQTRHRGLLSKVLPKSAALQRVGEPRNRRKPNALSTECLQKADSPWSFQTPKTKRLQKRGRTNQVQGQSSDQRG